MNTEASETLRAKAGQAREKLGDAVQNTRLRLETGAQEHPMRTILISAGAGVLLGMLLGLTRRHRDSD